MSDKVTVLATYKTRTKAKAASKALQQRRFKIKRLSLVAKDHNPETQVVALTPTATLHDLLRVLLDAGLVIEQERIMKTWRRID